MTSCIYFLFKRKKLIYIGQTSDFEIRVRSYGPYCYITKIRIIRCHPDKLKEYERRLIAYFRPPGNKQHNPDLKFKDPERFMKQTKRKFKREIIGL